jgi:hypothetical protein
MRKLDDADDSFEAEEVRSYMKLCPADVDLGVFVDASKKIINDFKTVGTPPTATEINRQLSALKSSIKELHPETRAVMRAREHEHWQAARTQGELYDDEWLQRAEHVSGGGAALDILKETSASKFTRKRWTAVKRTALIARSIFLFKCGNEKIEVSNSKLAKYIQWLFGEVGLEDNHPKKALRDFIKEHDVEKVDGNISRKVYKLQVRNS